MRSLRTWLIGSTFAALALGGVPGCSSDSGEEDDDTGALVEQSGLPISTSQTGLGLFGGYNTVLDQGLQPCVTFPSNLVPTVGDVAVDVKIKLVRSREELAKQLGFETDLAFKIPKAGIDARAEVMDSYKRTTSAATLLVRIATTYRVDVGQNFTLEQKHKDLYAQDPGKFLQRCGDAAVTALGYSAQVVALVTFDSTDEENARKIAGNAGVEAPALGSVADAKAKVKGSLDTARTSSKSKLNLEIHMSGFAASGRPEKLEGEKAIEELTNLIDKMAESVKSDRQHDLEAMARGVNPWMPSQDPAPAAQPAQPGAAPTPTPRAGVIERAAKISNLTFQAYAKSEPGMNWSPLVKLTTDMDKYLREVGSVGGRLENAYYEEVKAFGDAQDKELYNFLPAPKAKLDDLVPIYQDWASKLKPQSAATSVVARVKDAQDSCVRLAIGGDYTHCVKTEEVTKAVNDGEALLADYGKNGRIVRTNTTYASAGEVDTDAAQKACTQLGGRLPFDDEMDILKPALHVRPKGVAWVGARSCSGGIGIYNEQKGKAECYNRWPFDLFGSVAAVMCTPNSGPKPILTAPGE